MATSRLALSLCFLIPINWSFPLSSARSQDLLTMPSTARLLLCVGGIYASFLSWALVQERLSTTPYYAGQELHEAPKYFRHVIFLNTVQSTFSACAALLYIAYKKNPGISWRDTLGMMTTVCLKASKQSRCSLNLLGLIHYFNPSDCATE